MLKLQSYDKIFYFLILSNLNHNYYLIYDLFKYKFDSILSKLRQCFPLPKSQEKHRSSLAFRKKLIRCGVCCGLNNLPVNLQIKDANYGRAKPGASAENGWYGLADRF